MYKKHTIETIQKMAKSKGGKCLSKAYVNNKQYLMFQCEKGHKWRSRLDIMLARGYWCPGCDGRRTRVSISQMKKIAIDRGGKCLSDSIEKISDKLKWKCAKGHIWEASGNNVKNNKSWCYHCALEQSSINLRHDISIYKKIAIDRGGKCLSDKYINNNTKLKFICSNGHIWNPQPQQVKNGSWCPDCSPYLGERITRACFEQLFNKKFPKTKPDWLLNSRNNKMEFDGFCEELKVAFEHHGDYHSKLNFQNNYSIEKLNKRKADDKLKIKLAKKHNVKLIIVPWIRYELKTENLKTFLINECKKNGIDIPKSSLRKSFSYNLAYKPDQLAEAQEIAKKNNGKLISTAYLGSKIKYKWECNLRHQWLAVISNIKSGTWCPTCKGGVSLTLETIKLEAIKHGGECLSASYKNVSTKLLFKCKNDHKWLARPADVRRGHWCPECAGVALGTIEQMKKIAIDRGGDCLSKFYINSRTPLKWKCAYSHVWEMEPKKIKTGYWCSKCKVNK